MGRREYERVRAIALALPEVTERESHGAPCFFVRIRRPLCYFHDRHRGDGRISVWCPAAPGRQVAMVSADRKRFFRPTPSASGVFSDWLGVYLDGRDEVVVDWGQVADLIEDAYRLVAPRRLAAWLDEIEAGG